MLTNDGGIWAGYGYRQAHDSRPAMCIVQYIHTLGSLRVAIIADEQDCDERLGVALESPKRSMLASMVGLWELAIAGDCWRMLALLQARNAGASGIDGQSKSGSV